MSYERWDKHTAIIFAFICGILFFAGLGVHLSALFGFDFAHNFPKIWFFLQTSIFIVFLPLLIGNPYQETSKSPYIWGSAKFQGSSRFGTYLGLTAAVVLCLSLLYIIPGEIYWLSKLHFGQLQIIDGNYFLYFKRSRHLLPITFEDYQQLSLYRNLAHSVHWMFLHSLAFMINLSPLEIDLKKAKQD